MDIVIYSFYFKCFFKSEYSTKYGNSLWICTVLYL